MFQDYARKNTEPISCYEFKPGVNLLDANINTEGKFSRSPRLEIYDIVKDSVLTRTDSTDLMTKAKNYQLSLDGKNKADLEVEQNRYSADFLDFINDQVIGLFSKKFQK